MFHNLVDIVNIIILIENTKRSDINIEKQMRMGIVLELRSAGREAGQLVDSGLSPETNHYYRC